MIFLSPHENIIIFCYKYGRPTPDSPHIAFLAVHLTPSVCQFRSNSLSNDSEPLSLSVTNAVPVFKKSENSYHIASQLPGMTFVTSSIIIDRGCDSL